MKKTCLHCEKVFNTNRANQSICNPCKPLRKAELSKINYLMNKSQGRKKKPVIKEDIPVIANYKPTRRPLLMTDAAQLAINRSVDDKYSCPIQPVTIYRPGETGFNAVAAQITPLDRIKNSYSEESYSHGITAPIVSSNRRRYPEQTGELR